MLTPEEYKEKIKQGPFELRELRMRQKLERYFEEHFPQEKYDFRNVA